MTGSNQYDPTPDTAQVSTAEVAKGQASQVAGGAADAAQHVAGVAREQAGQVAAAAGQQVKQLAGKAQSELSDQATAQQTRLAGGLRSVGDQLTSMAGNADQQGVVSDLAHQAAGKALQAAGWLEDRTPADLLAELRSLARRRPGSFLAAALAAGVAAGRMARGLTADPAAPASAGHPPAPVRPAPAAVTARSAPLTLPGGRGTGSTDQFGTAPVRDWTTSRSVDGGDTR